MEGWAVLVVGSLLAAQPSPRRLHLISSTAAITTSSTRVKAKHNDAASHAAPGHADASKAAPSPLLPCNAVIIANPRVLGAAHYISRSIRRRAGAADPRITESRIVVYKSVELEEEVSRNGRLLPPRRRASERRLLVRLRRQIDRLWRGPQSNGHLVNVNGNIWPVARVCAHYRWRWQRNVLWRGIPAAIYAFQPHRHHHSRTRAGHFLDSLAGHVWLAPSNGQLLRATFHNLRPVRYGWGLLANFHRVRGVFSLCLLPGGWFYHRLQLALDERELWHRWHGQITKSYLPAGGHK